MFFLKTETAARKQQAPNFRGRPKTHTPAPRLQVRGLRFYSPPLGRWLSRDPIGENGGLGLYAFVGNRPVAKWDYLGLIIEIDADDAPPSFARKVIEAFQSIIGDCAKLKATAYHKRKWLSFWPPERAVVLDSVSLGYTNEKGKCRCDDCWQTLKAAIDNQGDTGHVIIRYTEETDQAYATLDETFGRYDRVRINPDISVAVLERLPSGFEGFGPKTPFPIALWHEAISHAWLNLEHPKIRANVVWRGGSWDTAIKDENRARSCYRRLGHAINDRVERYWDGFEDWYLDKYPIPGMD